MSIFDPVSAAPWEQISESIRPQVSAMIQSIRDRMPHDQSIRHFLKDRGIVYWTNLIQILEQRCDRWLSQLYEICCREWSRHGKVKNAEFVSSIWNYELEVFIYHDLPDLLRLALSSGNPQRDVRDSEATVQRLVNETGSVWRKRIEAEYQDLQVQRHESPISESLIADDSNWASKASKRETVGIARAVLVEKIRREIVELAQIIYLPEDYENRIRGCEGFATYSTVIVCNRHPDLREKLWAIKETKKPRIIELACQIASLHVANTNLKPILPSTFQDAHKRFAAKARKRLDKSR